MFGIKLPSANMRELILLSGALVLSITALNWLRGNKPTVQQIANADLPVPLIVNDVRPILKDQVKAYREVPPDVGVGKTNYGDLIYKKTYPIGDGNTVKNPYYMDLGKYATLLDVTV